MKSLKGVLSVLGSGIFAIGYTIGTGSVTSMAKSGADCGLGMMWILALSCVFSGVLMEAHARLVAVVVGVLGGQRGGVRPGGLRRCRGQV